jgi:hypothetical protein
MINRRHSHMLMLMTDDDDRAILSAQSLGFAPSYVGMVAIPSRYVAEADRRAPFLSFVIMCIALLAGIARDASLTSRRATHEAS